jgi:hypothetical protein
MWQISHQKKKMRMYYLHKILILFFQVKSITDLLDVENLVLLQERKHACFFPSKSSCA